MKLSEIRYLLTQAIVNCDKVQKSDKINTLESYLLKKTICTLESIICSVEGNNEE